MYEEFTCKKCNKIFWCCWALKQHLQRTTPCVKPIEWLCKICNKQFKSNRAIKQHLRSVHTEKTLPCEKCKKLFRNKWTLTQHLRCVHNCVGILLRCDECNKIFRNKWALMQHFKCVHPEMTFSCKKCNKQYKSKYALQLHLQYATSTCVKCDHCNKPFKNNRALKLHWLNVSTCASTCVNLICEKCNQQFDTILQKKNHSDCKKPDETEMNYYECQKCNIEFKSDHALKQHLQNGNNCVVICEHCNKKFISISQLNLHKQFVHLIDSDDICELNRNIRREHNYYKLEFVPNKVDFKTSLSSIYFDEKSIKFNKEVDIKIDCDSNRSIHSENIKVELDVERLADEEICESNQYKHFNEHNYCKLPHHVDTNLNSFTCLGANQIKLELVKEEYDIKIEDDICDSKELLDEDIYIKNEFY